MRIAIIPARGGSKRIPRKNIKEFHGKPLIAYSIEAALKSGCFDRVVVSTDDIEIAKISKEYGAEIPFFRPDSVSDDFATTLDVIKHAINELSIENTDIVCCLYATAPLIQITDLQGALKLLTDDELDYVFSATEFSFPIQRAIKINSEGLVDMFQNEHVNTRSQDLEKAYHDAGQFYFGYSRSYRENKNFFCGSKSRALLLPSSRVQDIDTLDDWKRAEMIYEIIQCKNEVK